MSGKDNLLKLIRENQVMAIVIAGLITILVLYMAAFAPLAKSLKTKYRECRTCEDQGAGARNMIKYAQNIDKSYGSRILISEKEAEEGREEFTKHGKSLGINFISMKPGNIIIKEGAFYKILPIELDIEATDKQLVDFMGSIDELKKSIVTIDSFDITPDETNPAKLHAKMVINIYLSAKDTGA